MNDTVQKLMQLADTYATNPFKEGSGSAKEYGETSRQALQEELTRLFTPLSDEQCCACNGSGRMVRDPDIGTDQECFVCDGSGIGETK